MTFGFFRARIKGVAAEGKICALKGGGPLYSRRPFHIKLEAVSFGIKGRELVVSPESAKPLASAKKPRSVAGSTTWRRKKNDDLSRGRGRRLPWEGMSFFAAGESL